MNGEHSPLQSKNKKRGKSAMQTNLKEYKAMCVEQDKCRKILSVWIIFKDGEKAGVVTARRSVNGKSSYVTVNMLPNKHTWREITGYEYIRDLCCESRAREGIAKILIRNREALNTYYGMDITCNEKWLSSNDGWENTIRRSGYDVIRVL